MRPKFLVLVSPDVFPDIFLIKTSWVLMKIPFFFMTKVDVFFMLMFLVSFGCEEMTGCLWSFDPN